MKQSDSFAKLVNKINTRESVFYDIENTNESMLNAEYRGIGRVIVDTPIEDVIAFGRNIDAPESDEVLAVFLRQYRLYGRALLVSRNNDFMVIKDDDFTLTAYIPDINTGYITQEVDMINGLDAKEIDYLYLANDVLGSTLLTTRGVLLDCQMELMNYKILVDRSTNIVTQLNQDVLKIDGLNDVLSEKGGEDVVGERMTNINALRGILSLIALDSNDEYSSLSKTVQGIEGLISTAETLLSGATRIPVSKLFGKTQTGLGFAVTSEMRNYKSLLESLRVIAEKVYDFMESEKSWEWNKIDFVDEEAKQGAYKLFVENQVKLYESGLQDETGTKKNIDDWNL